MGDFPAELFRMEGSPGEIRGSAARWLGFGAAATDAAGQITGLDTSQFVGPEADLFRDGLHGDMPAHLRITGEAFTRVASALETFAAALDGLQSRMRPLAARAPGLWEEVRAAQGRVSRAHAADLRHEREQAGQPPDPAGPDRYESDAPGASVALTSARAEWDACVREANGLRGELTTAVGACVRVIGQAREMRFKENPKWWDLGGQFTNFIRDNRELLQQLSGALKVISLVAGLLSFIPVLAPIMAPIAVGTALAASAIDLSVYAATGEGSLQTILIDVGLNLLPGAGKLFRMGAPLLQGTRVASAFTSVANRGRNMLSVARWGLSNPRANGIEAVRRLVRLDPIDIASGDMILTQTDVELPGLLPLVLSRTHISSYRLGSWFGRSWASTLDQRLEADEAGVYVATADGMTLVYPVPGAGSTLPAEGPRWPLSRTDDGYRVSDPWRGITMHFTNPVTVSPAGPAQWPITAITDRNGHRVDFVRDSDGVPGEVRHSGGYRVAVDTDRDRIVALRLLDGSGSGTTLRRFGYDGAGDLTEVINCSGLPLRYDYDTEGRVTRWLDRNGTEYRYVYDEGGRCVATRGSGGFLNGELRYDRAARTTTVIDSMGHATVYQINDLTQIESVTDPLGNVTRTTWDRYDRKLTETDPLGRTTAYEYDHAGDLVAITRPDGSRTTACYNDLHQAVTVVDYDDATWRREYDDRGNLVRVIDPAGSVTGYRYDAVGRLAGTVDPLGHGIGVRTDRAGLALAVTDPTGATLAYERDAAGRVVAVTEPHGATTRLGRTAEGLVAWRHGPGGADEEWTFDAEGNEVTHVDPAGRVTARAVGHFDLPVSSTRPDGATYRYAYDTELRLIAVTDPTGATWRYEYDPAGRLVRETSFDGAVTRYTYDAAGQLATRTNGAGQAVEHVRDTLGRVVEKRTAEGVTTLAYDAAGRLVGATSPDVELEIRRDAVGRVRTERHGDLTISFEYDAAGRLVRRRTPAGTDSQWEYDPRHQPTILTVGGHRMTFGHDPGGRETSRTYGGGVRLEQTWDHNHRLLEQIVTGATPAGQEQRASYSYGRDGLPRRVDDDLTGPRRLDLDSVGRVVAVTGAGWLERYSYDPAGRPTSAHWTGAGNDTGGDREYDASRVVRAGPTRYEYDAAGRITLRQRKRLSARPDTWRYAWDSEDRLSAVTTPNGDTWRYRYDARGRRVAKVRTAGGRVLERISFVWDGPRLVEQVRHAQGAADHATAWEYAPGSFAPVAQVDAGGTGPVGVSAVVADAIGTPTALVDADGRVVWRLVTSTWGSPGRTDGPVAGCPLRFPGQYHDAETGAYYNLHRYYDPTTGRYLSPDPLGLLPSPDPYGYVENPTAAIDPTGLAPYHLSSPNPLPRAIRDQYEEVRLGGGVPRIDPNTGQQTVFHGRELTPRQQSQWAGSLEWDVPGTPHRILQRPDGNLGYVLNHDYSSPFLFPAPWYPEGGAIPRRLGGPG